MCPGIGEPPQRPLALDDACLKTRTRLVVTANFSREGPVLRTLFALERDRLAGF
jgi:hypothetical protein